MQSAAMMTGRLSELSKRGCCTNQAFVQQLLFWRSAGDNCVSEEVGGSIYPWLI